MLYPRLPAARWLALGLALFAGCAAVAPESEGPPRKETLLAVTQGHELIRVNAGQPRRVLARMPIKGLAAGELLVGIDFRLARGTLYALSDRGRLFTLDAASGALTPFSAPPLVLAGSTFGFDFNPAADRIRIVSDSGLNLRAHPDTGAAVDGNADQPGLQSDPALAWRAGDVNAGSAPQVAAAGYTYNTADAKLTTNYAIERRSGALVMQGSKEGTTPAVSPNTGQLFTVGSLGVGPLTDVSFDIADLGGAAFAAVRSTAAPSTRLHLIDLATGKASFIGTLADGGPIRGLAIEP
jgi:hypothetical protein